jgi:ribosomal protein S3AE
MAQAKRKKRFLEVEIPIINKQAQVFVYDIEESEGRQIKYDLTRILRGKNATLNLKIKVQDGKATAHPVSLKLLPYYIKRMVRKGTNYVEDSFSTNCKDAQIKIKPFLITRRKVSRAVRKALRNKAREELIEFIKKKDTEEIFNEILHGSLQKTLSLKLKKIYPLSLCEIRIIKVEKELEKTKSKE